MRKVCLLTGASGTLGTAFCRLFAARYQIVAVHRRAPLLVPSQHQRLVDPLKPSTRIPANNHRVFAVRAELADDDELERLVRTALDKFGRIDVLVNAAAHVLHGELSDVSESSACLDDHFYVNATLPIRLAVRIADRFWRRDRSRNGRLNRNVVNVSSVSGTRIHAGLGLAAYSASKAALNMLTRHMAVEFEDLGVRVNAIAPTTFPQRIATERVAHSIVELDEGRMNGHVLQLDQDGTTLV